MKIKNLKFIILLPYKWCTKTRLRKILSSILAFLILLTSIKYIFISPSSVKATDVFIKLDEGYGTAPVDTNSVVAAGTITNATWQREELCKVGKCLFFDGTGDYVTYADNASLDMAAADTVTVEAWFRTTSISSGTRTLISKYNSSTGVDGGYKVTMNSSGQISFGIDADNTLFPAFSATSTTRYDDNLWHFVSAVKNGTSTISLYIDAASPITTNITSTDASNTDNFMIGRDESNTSNDWKGFVDEVKVLRTARTQAQIQTDMSAETKSQGAAATFGPDQSYISNGLAGYWKLDETALNGCSGGEDFCDSSGNGKHATADATTTTTNLIAGHFANGVNFDGVLNQATTPALSINTAAGTKNTVSFWMNWAGSSGESPFSWNPTSGHYAIWLTNTCMGFNTGAGDCWGVASTGLSGGWKHITAVFNNGNVQGSKLYINGVPQTLSQIAGSPATESLTATTTSVFGNYDSGTALTYAGKLDDIRIYSRELPAGDVLSLYNWAPGPVAYWNMDENTGTTANDISGGGNTGTLSGTTTPAWVTGKFGSANTFNGTTAYTAAGNGASLQITNNLTLDAWIKLTSNSTTQDIVARNGAVGSYNYRLYVNSSGQLAMEVSSNGTTVTTATGATTLSTGTWYHVAGVYVPSTSMTVYVNGTQDGQNTTSIPSAINNTSSIPVNLGAEKVAGATFIKECTNTGAAVTSLDITCATSAGNLLVVVLSSNSGSTRTYTITDSNGTSIVQCAACDHRPVGITNTIILHYLLDSQASTKVNVSINSATTIAVSVMEFSSVQASPLDVGTVGFQDTAGVSSTLSSGATATTAQANEVAAGGLSVRSSATITGTGTGWTYGTQATSGTTVAILGGYKILTATGTETNTGTTTGNPQWGANVATFKANTPAAANFFSGTMDDVRIYNYDRTPAQIIEDMNGGHPAPGSPVGSALGSYKFDEGNGDTINNVGSCGPTCNLTRSGLTKPSWTNAGKYEKALSFGGTNAYLAAASDISQFKVTGDLTLSAWINLTNISSQHDIICKYTGTAATSAYCLTVNTSGQLQMLVVNSTGPAIVTTTGTTAMSTSTWYHVAGVFKSATSVTLYINGYQDTQNTTSIPTTLQNPTTILDIGGENAGSNLMNGSIDNVNIFNSALTSDQIKVLYNQNSGAVMGAVSTDTSGNASFSSQRGYCPPGNIEANCAAGQDPSPIGEWLMDDNTGTTTAKDTTGNGNNGTISNVGSIVWTPGIHGSALNSDITTDTKVDMGSPAAFNNLSALTAEAWIYPRTTGDNGEGRFFDKTSSTGPTNGWYFKFRSSAQALNFSVDCVTTDLVIHTTNTLTLNTWSHVALTWDGNVDPTGHVHIYINGVEASYTGQQTCTGGRNDDTTGHLKLFNQQGSNQRTFDGYIDDARLYNYVRTQAQVDWDYNNGKPIAFWKMDESSWNGTAGEVKDSSGNALNGTRAGNATTTTSGKYNNAGTFDGTGDYFEVADNNTLDLTGDFTLTAWVARAGGSNGYIITKTNGTDGGYALLHGNAGEVYCRTSNGLTANDSFTATGLVNADSTWHFVAAVRSGTSCRVYVDGVDRTSTAATHTTLTANADNLRIASAPDGTSQVNGKIDDARIYNYAISSQQVKTIMNDSAALRYGP